MEIGNIFLHILVVFLCNFGCITEAVPLRLLFPFGEKRGDSILEPGDDVSSDEVPLTVPIVFYNVSYNGIYVNNNGHLSFESELPVYQANFVIPNRFKLIAAFLADVDTTFAGTVYYRESTETALLEKAAQDIQAHFDGFDTFIPSALFIATWDNVGFFMTNDTTLNTFQIVIASDGKNSFACFHYLDDGITWIQSMGKLFPLRTDPPAQAGFDSGDGRVHTKVRFSGTAEAARLSSESNVGVAGVWMYQIGNTGNIKGPGLGESDVTIFNPDTTLQKCQDGSHPQCHSEARCEEHSLGICCVCIPPSYGNGQYCLTYEAPQRLNGKIFGTLNGISIDNLDTHAYIVTSDGRTYTAFSRVPAELATLILSLSSIAGTIGWLFAVPNSPLSRNGFMITGGELNRTAIVTFQSGEEVRIRQRFFSQDTLNQMRLETLISGVVPDVLNGVKVTIGDYKEEYIHAARGLITSMSTRTYRMDDIAYQYTWNQTITFNECEFDPVPQRDTMVLSVKRNLVVYDPLDGIMRFAMTNKIGRLSGSDPCREAAQVCGEYAECNPTGTSFTCTCLPGFHGDGFSCLDIDECTEFTNLCDENARCYNVPGSFQCQCAPGYRGDGRTCTREVLRCGDDVCHKSARCVYNSDLGKPMCECRQGFRGDGVTCSAAFSCNEVDVCHQDAACVYDQVEDQWKCECNDGYSGDGTVCEQYTIDSDCSLCSADAQCLFDPDRLVHYCLCNHGYSGDGQTCTPITVPDRCVDCHPNAHCVFDDVAHLHTCQCNAGYSGDGFFCRQLDCRTLHNCHMYADCVNDTIFGGFRCLCKNGYTGDGLVCEMEDCSVARNCDYNAQCVADLRVDNRYVCRCNAGYDGDGRTCRQRVTPCNQVFNCGQHAECVYNPDEMSYRCRCSSGYEGNGQTCQARGYNCRSDPRICDPNAACILNVDTFICVCNENFRGDGRRCIAMDDDNNYLLFSRGYSIHRVPFLSKEDDKGARVLYVPDQLVVGIDSDCEDQTMYWTDVSNGQVLRANLDGTESTAVITGLSSPEGVAVDWLSRNLYWTDSGLDVISVSKLDGTSPKRLIQGNLVNPRAIILDPSKGMMYWADWNRDGAKIEMAYMDGEDRKVLVDSDLSLPNGLTIDYHTQQVCWGDAGVRKIECIRTDGIGRKTIVEDAAYPFDLTMVSSNIYWSDWTVPGVLRVSHNGGEVADPLDLPVGGNGKLYGVTAVRASCPRAINACARDNGGCTYLCLPTPHGGRTCGCPDDVDSDDCNLVA